MDYFTDYLLAFFSIAFLIETMILIGIFINEKRKNQDSSSFFCRSQKLMDEWDNDGPRWKKMGEIYMMVGAGATALEVGQFLASTNLSISFITGLLTLFTTVSPGLSIAGIGMGIYAFGVNLVDSQIIRSKIKK
jgi:hypothetical protein